MPRYLVLCKINPNQTTDALRGLRGLPEKPVTGVTLHYSFNVFGDWDACIWFDAGNHDQAMDFVQNKICPITGIVKTYTMPTTSIKEYTKGW